MKMTSVSFCAAVLLLCATSAAAQGGEVAKTYDFAIDNWNEIAVEDGPVTLHRIRLDRKVGRISQANLARRFNEEYLQPIRFNLEYSNSSSAKRRLRVTVRWLDEEGKVIDGFGAAETLQKKSSHRVVQASVATLKYGLDRARTLEVEIRFEP